MAGLGEKIKQTVEHGVHKVKGKPTAGKRILIVTTSCDKYGDTNEPTGTWAEEVVAPYYIFKEAGAHVDVASIKGGKIPIQKVSLGEGFVTDHVKRYFEDEALKHYVENSLSVKDVPSNYDAIFIPGTAANIGPWELCTNNIIFYHDAGSMIPIHRELTTSGYRALIYSGDHDMCVPYTGSEAWTSLLGYKVTNQWRAWVVGHQVAGYTKGYANNLTFVTIKESSHIVPEYKPTEALAFFQCFLAAEPL